MGYVIKVSSSRRLLDFQCIESSPAVFQLGSSADLGPIQEAYLQITVTWPKLTVFLTQASNGLRLNHVDGLKNFVQNQPYHARTSMVRSNHLANMAPSAYEHSRLLGKSSIKEATTRILEVRTAYTSTFSWLYNPEVVSFNNWLRGDTQDHGDPFPVPGTPLS